MDRTYYFIIEMRDAWWVNCAGRLLGPYDTREPALSAGIRVATVFGDPTIHISIIGPDENANYVVLWRGSGQRGGRSQDSADSDIA